MEELRHPSMDHRCAPSHPSLRLTEDLDRAWMAIHVAWQKKARDDEDEDAATHLRCLVECAMRPLVRREFPSQGAAGHRPMAHQLSQVAACFVVQTGRRIG